ncbi:BTB/POZ domain-containing protein [Phthorimaea operculella]|nr:BTB/POZ domain-containing protein [Phthorimaea operculella]
MATETGGAAGGGEQQYSLRWNDFHSAMVSSFRRLRDEEDFVDVTLACAGATFTAHKVVLSACSPYFRRLLKANPCSHPIVILRDVHDKDMESLLRFMYQGEVNIGQEQLKEFLRAAQLLQVRGLTDVPQPSGPGPLDQKASPSASSWTESGSAGSRESREPREGRRLRRPDDNQTHTPPPKRARSSDLYQAQLKSRTDQLMAQGASPERLERLERLGTNGHELSMFAHQIDNAQNAHLNSSNNMSGEGEDSSSDAGASDTEEPRAKQEPQDYEEQPQPNGTVPHFPGLLNLPGFPGLPGPSGIPDNFGGCRRTQDLLRVRATDPRPCPKCGKIYRSAHTLRTHLEDKHTVCPGYRSVSLSRSVCMQRAPSAARSTARRTRCARTSRTSTPCARDTGQYHCLALSACSAPPPQVRQDLPLGAHAAHAPRGQAHRVPGIPVSISVSLCLHAARPKCGKIYRSAHTLRTHLEDKHTVCPGYRSVSLSRSVCMQRAPAPSAARSTARRTRCARTSRTSTPCARDTGQYHCLALSACSAPPPQVRQDLPLGAHAAHAPRGQAHRVPGIPVSISVSLCLHAARPRPKCGKIYRSAHTLRTHLEDKHTVCPGYRSVSLSRSVCMQRAPAPSAARSTARRTRCARTSRTSTPCARDTGQYLCLALSACSAPPPQVRQDLPLGAHAAHAPRGQAHRVPGIPVSITVSLCLHAARPRPKCGKIYRSAHTLRTHLEDKHTVCPGYRSVSLSRSVCMQRAPAPSAARSTARRTRCARTSRTSTPCARDTGQYHCLALSACSAPPPQVRQDLPLGAHAAHAPRGQAHRVPGIPVSIGLHYQYTTPLISKKNLLKKIEEKSISLICYAPCVLCGTVAKSRNSLHSHMSRQHRGISTKDLPVLQMPTRFDPELASQLLAKAGVKVSPEQLRARASPTGPRRSDIKLDAKSAASETSSLCGGDEDDLSQQRYPDPPPLSPPHLNNLANTTITKVPAVRAVTAKSAETLPGMKDAGDYPPAGFGGSALLDTYLQFMSENMFTGMNQAKLAQMSAMHMERKYEEQWCAVESQSARRASQDAADEWRP